MTTPIAPLQTPTAKPTIRNVRRPGNRSTPGHPWSRSITKQKATRVAKASTPPKPVG